VLPASAEEFGEEWNKMKSRIRKSFTVICTAAILALTTVSAATAADNIPPPKDIYKIVALGDSISVGYEPKMDEKSVPYGYVDRLYEQALYHGRSELANYAIMGLTTPGLDNLLQGAASAKPLTSADLQDFSSFDPRVAKQADVIAAQTSAIASDLKTADLVVLTIGANDFGPIIKAVRDQSTADARLVIQSNFDNTMNNYTENLDKVITHLHELAPDSQIVVADQYLPLFTGHVLYPDLLDAVKKLSKHLDAFAEQLTKDGINVQIVHISDKYISNYFNLLDGFDTHPKQAGYETIAQSFADVVWKQYLKPSPKASEDKLSIIINGQELFSEVIVKNNTTFLALRDIANAVKAELKWNQKQQTATFLKNGREVTITIGTKTMLVNGVSQPVDTPAYFQKVGKIQKTYVPLAVIIKGLDYNVVYRKKIKTIFINS
jgi:lysophospholipase L1-like esterase